MIKPTTPANETERLRALKEFAILDTLPEKEYDDITRLASLICETPISLVSLIDETRQWFKSHHGTEAEYTSKDIAFCAHAIHDKDNIFIIPDSRKDERFVDNPLVTGDPHVIFYAGIPLVTLDGYPLGTLCVIDSKPKLLSDNQIQALRALSSQLMKLFELRKAAITLQNKVFELETQNKGLTEFAHTAAHDIKSPLNSIIMTAKILEVDFGDKFDGEGKDMLFHIGNASRNLAELIDGILRYSKDSSLLSSNKQDVALCTLVEKVAKLVNSRKQAQVNINIPKKQVLFTNAVALERILINILSNCIKYNDKETPIIDVAADVKDGFMFISIADNGPGIAKEDQKRVFNIFETAAHRHRNGVSGTGIGLATVKSLVEGLGGKVSLRSELGQGTVFSFSIRI